MFSNPLRLLYASFVVVEAFIRFAANMNGFLISRKCCINTNILNTKTVAIVQNKVYNTITEQIKVHKTYGKTGITPPESW